MTRIWNPSFMQSMNSCSVIGQCSSYFLHTGRVCIVKIWISWCLYWFHLFQLLSCTSKMVWTQWLVTCIPGWILELFTLLCVLFCFFKQQWHITCKVKFNVIQCKTPVMIISDSSIGRCLDLNSGSWINFSTKLYLVSIYILQLKKSWISITIHQVYLRKNVLRAWLIAQFSRLFYKKVIKLK